MIDIGWQTVFINLMPTDPLPAAPSSQTLNERISFADVIVFASHYWRQQPLKLTFVLIMMMTGSLIETYIPTALASFLSTVRAHNSESTVLNHLLIFLGAYVAQTVTFALGSVVYNNFETTVFRSLVSDVFAHIYQLPETFFLNTFTGSILSKINRARQKIETFEDQFLVKIFPTIIIIVGSVGFLSLRFPVLGFLMALYITCLLLISGLVVFKLSGPAQGIYADAQDHFSAHLADSISGIATTRSYAQEIVEIERFTGIIADLRVKNLRAYLWANGAGIFQRLLLTGMLTLMLGGGTWYYFRGEATVESIAYLAFAYTIAQSYIRDLGDNIKNIFTSSYDLHAVIRLTREKPEVVASNQGKPLSIKRGAIRFDDIKFTYPSKEDALFDGLSVDIKAGERIALVGHSGSGKTTFIRLLQRLYTLDAGAIWVDEQNIATGSLQSLRASIALVPQEPILFHRSLRDNIAYGKPLASLEEVHLAARQANIHEFITRLPQGYATLVGERGVKLSGGERQRIAIARAILADRPILILDEATSSLDSASERAIQDALKLLTRGRTSIMIAHRLSTILDADRIFVFDNGKIVEEGTHIDLIERAHSIYAEFFRLQSGGFLVD